MTKIIYVPVDEFEENGGIVCEGRRVFEKNDNGLFEYSFTAPSKDYLMSAFAKSYYYVQIQCTPIYK